MRRFLYPLLLSAVIALPAAGELSESFAGWGEGPAKWLMTGSELLEWNGIDEDDEARRFIELFWARRDPTPATPRNEFGELFQARAKIADEQFDEPRTRGSLSPRGRVFLLLGSPYRTSLSLGAAAAGARDDQASREIWHYERQAKPPFAEGPDFDIEFIDRWSRGEFELSTIGRRDPQKLLNAAIDYYLVQPNLAEVPRFDTAATEAIWWDSPQPISQGLARAIENQRSSSESGGIGIYLTYDEAVTPSGGYYVPLQLFLDAGQSNLPEPGPLTFFGSVTGGDGSVVASYEEPAILQVSGSDLYVDKALRVKPGEYLGTFGLAREGSIIGVSSATLWLDDLDADGASVSGLMLSTDVHPMPQAQDATEPFAFGGLKIVPKGDLSFAPEEEIWFFVEARNPELGDGGAPRLAADLELTGKSRAGDEVRMGGQLPANSVQPVADTQGHYLAGGSLPSGTLTAGHYVLTVTVRDELANRAWTVQREFEVSE